MGVRYLQRWHRTFLRVPHGIALVIVGPAARSDEVVAFLLGITDQAAHTAALLRDRRVILELAGSGSLSLLARPRLAARFVRTRGRPWLRKLLRHQLPSRGSAAQPAAAVAVLAAVAVETSARGRGLGAHLVRRFLAEARNSGAGVAELVTVAPADGGAAAGFYERLGWRAVGDLCTRDGTTVRTYVYILREQSQLQPRGEEATE